MPNFPPSAGTHVNDTPYVILPYILSVKNGRFPKVPRPEVLHFLCTESRVPCPAYR
jgi:hypothetical protein